MSQAFTVIDKLTGQAADMEQIALKEKWADGLIYCDMEGFALEQDGTLLLLDECGNFAYCPPDRFELRWSEPQPEPTEARTGEHDCGKQPGLCESTCDPEPARITDHEYRPGFMLDGETCVYPCRQPRSAHQRGEPPAPPEPGKETK